MNASQFAKAAKYFDKIKKLDAEIIEIDRVALLIANGKAKTSIEMKVEEEKEKEEDKISLDQDDDMFTSLYKRYYSPISWLLPTPDTNSKSDNHTTLNVNLSETASLQILGILLGEKTTKRNKLIKSLQSMGITI